MSLREQITGEFADGHIRVKFVWKFHNSRNYTPAFFQYLRAHHSRAFEAVEKIKINPMDF